MWSRLSSAVVVGLLHVVAAQQLPAAEALGQTLRFGLWQRGDQLPCGSAGCEEDGRSDVEALLARWSLQRHSPILALRGGGDGCTAETGTCEPAEPVDIDELRIELGPEFSAAIDENEHSHREDCDKSCESFYCGSPDSKPVEWAESASSATPEQLASSVRSFPMGSVPPEDFASEFRFPLDLIKVTTQPMIPPEEAEEVVAVANAEGLAANEYNSGKYKLGGDWVTKMPRTLAWFNRRLESTVFPTVAALFPEVVKGPEVLRAHSVAILKYNASHPRTDVHVDDGILALTLALSPRANYTGGGTFFEHLGDDNIVEMEQGHCTMRPGSVRHGGHRVSAGERYIIGAFMLIADRVEHVRRLNIQGSDARSRMDLKSARRYFKWAVRINPKCATCLKNWAESISVVPEGQVASPAAARAAEEKLRRALELLPSDSDALFSLGTLLSSQGRKDEAFEVFRKSFTINAEDEELCYNLGMQLGDRGDVDGEIDMYRRALSLKPDMAAAWANMGVAYASSGRVAESEEGFMKACEFEPENHMNWVNLAKLHMAMGRKEMGQEAMMKAKELGFG